MQVATLETSPTKEQIHEMAKETGPCLSFLFRLAEVPGTRDLRLQHLVDTLKRQLAQAGLSDQEAKSFLDAIRTRVTERLEQRPTGCLAIYQSLHKTWVFDVSCDIRDFAMVGNSFHITPLIPSLSDHREFYLLALSQKHTRLIRCTTTNSIEVSLPPSFPTNLTEFNSHAIPDHRSENHSSGGQNGSISFGTKADADKKGEYLHNFFSAIDKQLQIFLGDQPELPVIIAGVDYEVALYHKISNCPHLIPGGVIGSPDGLKGGELHSRAIQVLEQLNQSRAQRALDIQSKASGQRVSSDLDTIAAATVNGRVLNLFVAADAKRRGVFDEISHKTRETDSGEDLLNWMMLQTLGHGGDVYLFPRDKMPNQTEIAAYMRY